VEGVITNVNVQRSERPFGSRRSETGSGSIRGRSRNRNQREGGGLLNGGERTCASGNPHWGRGEMDQGFGYFM